MKTDFKAAGKGRTQIKISRPVKSLLPCDFVKNARNISPLFLRFLPCHRTKSNFTGCIAVLSEIFFVQTKQQNLGNTLCITEIFYEVWAENSLSKPTYFYLSPPNRPLFMSAVPKPHIIYNGINYGGGAVLRYRRLYYGRKTVIFRAVCLALALLIAVLLADAQLRPAVTELAALEAHRLATERINAAVVSVLSQGAPEYSELVKVSYGTDNSITGVSTDAVKLNLFKARVTEAIDAAFEDKERTEVRVPLGTATGVSLFSGIGPQIKVKVGCSASTASDFENVFASAGVNQTQHSVMLNIETTVVLSLAGRRMTEQVQTSLCIAQTVIVGSVPNVSVTK